MEKISNEQKWLKELEKQIEKTVNWLKKEVKISVQQIINNPDFYIFLKKEKNIDFKKESEKLNNLSEAAKTNEIKEFVTEFQKKQDIAEKIKKEKEVKVKKEYVDKVVNATEIIKQNRKKYEKVAIWAWISKKYWDLIWAIHFREAWLDFNCYLHNWDPLWKKTVNYPKWKFFKDWTTAAIDAIKTEIKDKWLKLDWTPKSIINFAETYNWFWYRDKWINSPYVWAWTDKYNWWLYVADWNFSKKAVDKRPWVVAIMAWIWQHFKLKV